MKKIFTLIIFAITLQPATIFCKDRGYLCIITGSMCSGKSGALIEQTKRWLRAKKMVATFKPVIDNRKLQLKDNIDPTQVLSSRTETSICCVPVSCVQNLKEQIELLNPSHIIIDEVHFFTPEKEDFIALILSLIQDGKQIILSGLDVSFRNEPFGPMPELLAHADHVEKLTANCAKCHQDVYCITQRMVNGEPAPYNSPLIVVGAEELYEPRCRKCHECPKN